MKQEKIYIDFIAYTDIGSSLTPKNIEFQTLVNSFSRERINNIFVRNTKKQKRYKSVIPFGNLIPKLMTGITRYITNIFPSRKISTKLFDFCLSKRLRKDVAISYFLTSLYPKSLKKSKKLGRINICQEMVAHPKFNNKLIRKEFEKWDISSYKKYEINHKNIDYFFVISNYIKRTFIKSGVPSNKIVVIPYGGYDHLRKKPLNEKKIKEKEELTFLFVGNSWIIKGVPYLLKAWEKINVKNAKLQLIGIPGVNFDKIKSKFKYKNIEVIGFKDPSHYYEKADVLINPALTDGKSKIVPEAMSYGLLPVTTFNDGSSDLIKSDENGFLIEPHSIDEIANVIKKILNKRKKVKNMRKEAIKSIQDYTWEINLKSIPSIIEKIIEKYG